MVKAPGSKKQINLRGKWSKVIFKDVVSIREREEYIGIN